MNALEAILGRRSIRKFTGARVSEEDVETLLKAAMSAPSACNQQPWHFIVVRNRESLKKIMEAHPYTKMLDKASVAIIVCGDPELQDCPGYWVQDCSAATENLLIAANAIGLGATWCGVYPADDRVLKLKEIFGTPKQVVSLCVVAVGVPDEKKPPSERFNEDRIHFEHW
jgi:nitroreductase